ncbi:MAG: YkgJ family cysteine cluster protein [Meiothermus sp.]|nr:YkgJ family cysteine cluster protein [Meiothermus sp.]
MPFRDSIDKIITTYLAGVTASSFQYKGMRFHPKRIKVSPLIFRDYTCPIQCGGCCPRFSLDYLPDDSLPYPMKERSVEFNGKMINLLSDLQNDHMNHFCRNLDLVTGRCGIYSERPFTCDFELIRFIHYENDVVLTQKLFGRGWAMKRVDGSRGARCEMLSPNVKSIEEVVRKLKRLEQWANHFKLSTRLPQIIDWCSSGSHAKALLLP